MKIQIEISEQEIRNAIYNYIKDCAPFISSGEITIFAGKQPAYCEITASFVSDERE